MEAITASTTGIPLYSSKIYSFCEFKLKEFTTNFLFYFLQKMFIGTSGSKFLSYKID